MNLVLAKTFYHEMLLIRRFEEKCMEMYSKEKIRGFLHLYIGQEAVAVGVMHALGTEDAIFATYREHGHALARGIHPNEIMAELYGKQEGCSHGRGGSMHLFNAATRFYGGIAIVAGGLPMAVGMALSDKLMKRNRVTVCFFGDGAVAEGEFHESLNLAALWHLPILFICENNRYAMGTALEFTESETNISLKAASYRITSSQVDGMDVMKVYEASKEALEFVRTNSQPYLLEIDTYRFRGHSMGDPERYRKAEEVKQWQENDPIGIFNKQLLEKKIATRKILDEIEARVEEEILKAVEFAEASPEPAMEELYTDIYAD